jgi:transposase
MDHKTDRRSDCQKKSGGGIRYHYTHIYRLMHKWGFKQKVPRKTHVNTASKEEKERLKKSKKDTIGYSPAARRIYSSIYR